MTGPGVTKEPTAVPWRLATAVPRRKEGRARGTQRRAAEGEGNWREGPFGSPPLRRDRSLIPGDGAPERPQGGLYR